MEKNKFVEKKWSREQIEIRLENLKKIIDPFIINMKIHKCKSLCDSEYDALYMAFYDLKDQYSRLPRIKFGAPKLIGYVPKNNGWYATSDNEFINVLTTTEGNTTWTTHNNGFTKVLTTSGGWTYDYANYDIYSDDYTWEVTTNNDWAATTSNVREYDGRPIGY